MSLAKPNVTTFLKDYQSPEYLISHVELYINLDGTNTKITAKLSITPSVKTKANVPLKLLGGKLHLESVTLDGKVMAYSDYEQSQNSLTILNPPSRAFILETKVLINPENNLDLEGLYKSQGVYCTQCEAQGFRNITYFLDRPDIMATYQVRLEGDKSEVPVLLSNGHCIEKGDLKDNRHFALWEDPFPKPCYLFALVAGDLARLQDLYKTPSNRTVALNIYAAHEDIDKCHHAMESLKQAMKWDEETFHLECDLDEYNIVAISDFNLGAMENKGLNIFNNALILANPDIARDANYQDILSVIGHEYFHNWTGNRVTCRDWFQLCLKEGLTVFRDQEFSGSVYSRAVKRIEDVAQLRRFQWPEDESPLAHPPRPDRYIEINNFYTSTVYNKGAEIVRMLKLLIGERDFFKGMALYFERHDGQAVCQEDFVDAMADASGQSLNQFMCWYTEAGTPRISISSSYDQLAEEYTIEMQQQTKGFGIQKESSPRHIPVKLALLASDGTRETLSLKKESVSEVKEQDRTERILSFTQPSQSFTFCGIKSAPVASLFRDFSAAVKIEPFQSEQELIFLMQHDTDPFNVWDAGQRMFGNCIKDMLGSKSRIENRSVKPALVSAWRAVLMNSRFDPAFKALTLSVPSEQVLGQMFDIVDVDAIHLARNCLIQTLARANEVDLRSIYDQYNCGKPYSALPADMDQRLLKNLCLRLLHAADEQKTLPLVLSQYHEADNMTDRDAALSLIIEGNSRERQEIISSFYHKWQGESLAIDRWFSLQASSASKHPKALVEDLLAHEAFTLENPNRMRSVLLSFAAHNPTGFHHLSGCGYKICADYVLKLNDINRQMAALLVKTLTSWKKHKPSRQNLMLEQLRRIEKHDGISPHVFEIVHASLADAV